MSRYIDAEKIEYMDDGVIVSAYKDQIDDIPTADVAPVVHAHWKLKAKLWWGTIYECSHCGRFVTLDKGTSRILLRTDYPHCHCGAKMDMDEEVKHNEQ